MQWFLKFLVYGSSYVLGAVETFLKAVPSAGMFRGNESKDNFCACWIKLLHFIYFLKYRHVIYHLLNICVFMVWFYI